MIDPTREEWLAARERVYVARYNPPDTDGLVKAVLGPCPPEPAPEPFRIADDLLVSALKTRVEIPGFWLTPDEADAMAGALVEHAAYARERGSASA